MELVSHNDSILNEECKDFNFADPPFDPIEFSKELVKFMYDRNGLCIAANQVGIPYRFFAMRGYPENFVCFNPKLVMPGDAQVVLEETSLTFPNLIVKIKRPRDIRVRFQTPNGETRTETYTGMTARIFQHALDHLNGIKFFNNANAFHKEQALKRWKKK
jgi:peptide deformylase